MSLVMIIMCAKLCMSKAFQVGEVKGVGVTQVGQVCLLNTFT
jgi:hypothetical protein